MYFTVEKSAQVLFFQTAEHFYCVPTEDLDAERERRRLTSSARFTLASLVRSAKRRA